MGGGFMENIFDCNEEKMQIFSTLCKNFILAQILAIGIGLSSGISLISRHHIDDTSQVIFSFQKHHTYILQVKVARMMHIPDVPAAEKSYFTWKNVA